MPASRPVDTTHMVLAVLLETLLRTCASAVGPRTMTAIVRVESGGNPIAMHDNTLGRSFTPPDRPTAIAWADELIAMGHSVDLGIAQINSANLPSLGLSTTAAFDPCANLHAGATILHGDYRQAVATFGPGQTALRHAIGAYNSGSIFGGTDYLDRILAAAGFPPSTIEAPALVPLDADEPVRGDSPTTAASLARTPHREDASSTRSPWHRAAAPQVRQGPDEAQPQMIVVGAAAAAAAPVVIDGP